MILAKCLGSRAMPVAAADRIAGIWLTPMLDIPEVHQGLRQQTAPTLIVGGTRDPHWDSSTAHNSGHEILELDNADHGLEIPGNVPASLHVLTDVMTAISTFSSTL
ncbi:hypothetical protein AQI88_38490 [Streptomyces cellostaticus]|uniref:Alpha/beta hydrolase n=1 Tax=Streptomyces cellostaticus TaxID=67285 RepID=A0A101NDF3_9ACTN|nr:alpha/beta hydrolase [Streptomyces cellostaticus]KUM91077.1 hypothetical protein AQI88_38490 [Streptomyces cellostaticus]GHI01726.1 hypothetical protein Scel_00470 [Streptomyces cellostaticus]